MAEENNDYVVKFKKNRLDREVIISDNPFVFAEEKIRKGYKKISIKRIDKKQGDGRHHHRFNLPQNQRK